MDRLWSPWRYRYVSEPGARPDCIFCNIAAQADQDEANLVVFRAEHNFVILNLYPYTSGHLMVVPYQHVATLEETPVAAVAEMMILTQLAERILRQTYRPQGINLGMNIGASAGAGVDNHIHMHVLPRWMGDANFMTTIGETRVMPEDLAESWRRLHAAFEATRGSL